MILVGFCLAAIGFAYLAMQCVRVTRDFLRTGIRVVGRVVRFEEAGMDGTVYLRPVFGFIDEGGVEQIVPSQDLLVDPPFAVGSKVLLIYPPDRADLVEFVGPHLWKGARVFGIFVLCCVVGGIIFALRTLKH